MANGTTTLVSGNVPSGTTGQEGQRLYINSDSKPVLTYGTGETTSTSTLLVSEDTLNASLPTGIVSVDYTGTLIAKGEPSTAPLTIANPVNMKGGFSATSNQSVYTAALDNTKGGLFVTASQPNSGTGITIGGGIVLGYPSTDSTNAPYYSTLGQFNDNGTQKLALHVRGSENDDITKSFVFTSGASGTLYLPSGDEVATISMLKSAGGGSGSTVVGDYLPLSGGTMTGDIVVNAGHSVAFHSPKDNAAFSTMSANNDEGLFSIYSSSSKGSGFWTFGYDRLTMGFYGQENPPTVAFLSDIDAKVSAATDNKVNKTGDSLVGDYNIQGSITLPTNANNSNGFHFPTADASAFTTMFGRNTDGAIQFYTPKAGGFYTFGDGTITLPSGANVLTSASTDVTDKVNKTGDTLTGNFTLEGYYTIPASANNSNAFTFGDAASGKFTNLLSDANGHMNFYTPQGSWVFSDHTATTPDGSTLLTNKDIDPSITTGLSNLGALTRTQADNAKLSQAERANAQVVFTNLSITNLFNWTGGNSQNSISVQNPKNDPNYSWTPVFNDSNAQHNNDDFTAAGGGFYVAADSSALPGKLKGMPFYANFQYQLVETQDSVANASGKFNHHLTGAAVLHVTSGGFDENDNALTGASALGADYTFGTDGRIRTPNGTAVAEEDFTSGYEITMGSSFDNDKADFGGTVAQGNYKTTVGAGNGSTPTKTQWGVVKVIPSKTNGGWATYNFPTTFDLTPNVTLTPNYFVNTSSGVAPIPAGTNVYLGQVTNTTFAVTVVDKDGNQTSISDIITVNFTAMGF